MNEYLSPFKENLNKSKHLSTSKKASKKIIRFSRIHNLDIYFHLSEGNGFLFDKEQFSLLLL